MKLGLRNSFWFLSVYFAVFIVWRISIPGVTTSLYAEDGQIYLSDAINSGSWNSLLKTYAGYIDVPARLNAGVTALFPVEKFALVNTLLLLVWITLCSMVVFASAKRLLNNSFLAVFCSAFFLLNPAGRFESSGNLTNLHFFLMAATSIVVVDYLKNRKIYLGGCIFVFFSALSTPLVGLLLLMAIPVFVHGRSGSWRSVLGKRSPFPYLIGGTGIMVAASYSSLGEREPNGYQSIFKVMYLTTDRILGSTFIPGWGSVSGAQESPEFSGLAIFHNLTLRVVLAFIVGIAFLVLVCRKSNQNRSVAGPLALYAFAYCLLIGFFYNLEPRYTVVPTFMLFLAFLLSITRIKGLTTLVIGFYVVLLLTLSSLQDSNRDSELNWAGELSKATQECRIEMQKTQKIQIAIPPADEKSRWHVLVPCSLI